MPKDHFIPAALLGRFSSSDSGPLRERRLEVVSRHTSQRMAAAAAIGARNGLYNVDRDAFAFSAGRAVDRLWDAYEPRLSSILDNLINGTLSATDWIRVIVPFVAATFARDRWYAARVAHRYSQGGLVTCGVDQLGLLDPTTLNVNRVIEFNRFAARAILSEWTVYESDDDLVISDLGFGFDLMQPYEGRDVVGLLLPIGKRHILELVPAPERVVAQRAAGGAWEIPIAYAKADGSAAQLNKSIVQCAQDFVAGTQAAVASVRTGDIAIFGPAGIDDVLTQWPFNVDTLMVAGIHLPIDRLLHDEVVDLDRWLLDRQAGIRELEPELDFRTVFSARRTPASTLLANLGSKIVIRGHVRG